MEMAIALVCVLLFANQASPAAAQSKMVFAHYLIYFPDTIATYKQEIQLAQSKGIDAFALNTNIYRKTLFDNMYQAAKELGTNFKLFFSADIHIGDSSVQPPDDRLSKANIVSMLVDYRAHPNQLQYKNKAFFTSWLGNDDSFWGQDSVAAWDDIFSQAGGKSLYYFLPFFPTDGSYFGVKGTIYDRFGSTVDGTYGWETSAWNYQNGNFSAPAISPGDADSLRVSNDLGKTYMAMVSPWFFKDADNNQFCCVSTSSSCDPNGRPDSWSGCPCQVKGDYQGPGLWLQKWSQIIASSPPLVEIATWNDWFEGHYVSPALSQGASGISVDVAGLPHEAYLELGKHYISWYKTGSEPVATRDELYLFYFTQSHSTTVANKPCGILHADKLSDAVYVVTVLSPGASATITLKSGALTSFATATQGVNVHGMGFQTGTQSATFQRGSVSFTLTGSKPISNSGLSKYNFNVYSIFCADVQNGKCGSSSRFLDNTKEIFSHLL